jgi:hypothetical protein
MGKERKKLSLEQALELLPDADLIHTFRNNGKPSGIHWPREAIVERFRTHGVEYAGDDARRHNHGLCSFDESSGWLFVETRKEAKKAPD